ncbi:MAG: SMC-Scp complex subunit ScpB [Chloroflexota bacterium]
MQPNLHPAPDDDQLQSALESLLLVAGGPVALSSLATATATSRATITRALKLLQGRLSGGIRLQLDGDWAQLVSAPENVEQVHAFLGTAKPPPLSRATLETLTVIAYRQPLTRAEVDTARGVNSNRPVQILLARGLIEERGARDALGHPMQYGTGLPFLEYFGLASLEDLPPIPEAEIAAVNAETIGLRRSSNEEPVKGDTAG